MARASLSRLRVLTDLEALVGGLDVFTDQDLIAKPPRDDETLGELGIGKLNLDMPVRLWINRRFLIPKGKPALRRGKLTPSTKFGALKKMCGL